MDKIIVSFLNTKYPHKLTMLNHRTKQGMEAIVVDICSEDSDSEFIIGKYIFYLELDKGFTSPTNNLNNLISTYFGIGSSEINRIFTKWVNTKLPNIKHFGRGKHK